MKWSNYTSALGDNMSPFAPKKACDPATAIGIGVGAASLIGSAVNAYQNLKNQANTNEMNYKIHQEQLAAQRENWKQEQENYLQNRKWQLEDVADQRRYDSPQAQKARYLAAGINPYLANSIGQGQAVQSPPQAPNFSSPSPAPEMRSTPVDFGIGQGISSAAQAYYSAKSEQRADYALAADITFRDRASKTELLNTAIKAKEAGVSEKWIDAQIKDAERNYYFNQDRFARENEWQNMQHNLEQQRIDIEAFRADTERLSVQSGIALNQASITRIAQDIQESKARVLEMKKEGYSKEEINAYIASKEKALATIAKRESEKVDRQAKNLPLKIWDDFASGLLSPLKGLISIGGKF